MVNVHTYALENEKVHEYYRQLPKSARDVHEALCGKEFPYKYWTREYQGDAYFHIKRNDLVDYLGHGTSAATVTNAIRRLTANKCIDAFYTVDTVSGLRSVYVRVIRTVEQCEKDDFKKELRAAKGKRFDEQMAFFELLVKEFNANGFDEIECWTTEKKQQKISVLQEALVQIHSFLCNVWLSVEEEKALLKSQRIFKRFIAELQEEY